MWDRRSLVLVLAMVQCARMAPGAEAPITLPNGPGAFAHRTVAPMSDQALAVAIDRALAIRWAERGVTPAPMADDATFLRRVALDVAGHIPHVSQTRAFLASTGTDKRRQLVDRLLDGPAYPNHMTDLWVALLLPEAKNTVQTAFFAADFRVWLRNELASGAGYDSIVRAVLTVPPTNGRLATNAAQAQEIKPSAFAFLAAKEGKPENLAASTSRLFLGVRLECAQCHNHPFARWKRDEFWGLAAFFSGLRRQGNGNALFQATEMQDKHEIEMPGTKRIVQASFLDGRDLEWRSGQLARGTLADWVTARDNPYFARAAVNRLWAQFFGVGLVDPVDDMGDAAECSHPELLDLLADQFAAHGFDFKYLIRAITSSRAYQSSSEGGSPSSQVYRLFDRMPVRGLTPEQLYDSLAVATGRPAEVVPIRVALIDRSPRGEFLERFAADDERPTERQTSILQALTLMNGGLVTEATGLDSEGTLAAVVNSDFLDTAGKIQTLYLATLGRPPRPDERARLVPYVERGGPALDSKKAMADVLWALLGSAEFVFNH